VHDLLEMADERQHREPGLPQHTVLPRTAQTQGKVGWIALRGMEAGIPQDHHALLKLPNEPLQGVSRTMGSGTRPRDHQAVLVQQQTEVAADKPAMIGEPLAAALLGAAAFARGVHPRAAIRINDAEHRWGSHADAWPVLVGPAEAQEPGPLG